MYLPNYKDGSIVNLMSSILQAYGEGSEYGPLRNLDIKSLRRTTNIILLVLDGLGYEFMLRHGEGSVFNEYLHDKIRRAVLESAVSEESARMVAMESASKNADDMISKLTLMYNRARQASITKEIIEISSGAEALAK